MIRRLALAASLFATPVAAQQITVNPPLGLPSASGAFTCTAAGVCTIASSPLSALTGLGTNVATALAIAVGSAGGPVTNGGALGTPSSGVATNLTGTAAGLTAGAVAVGGITGLGTGVATALAVNVGSAGAFTTFNGAHGTPSSLVGTNITGTAASLTAGNVTTNANLTGDVTSVGNATTLTTGSASNLNSGTLPSGRISGSYTGLTGTGALAAGSLAAGFTVVGPALGGTGVANNAASTWTISGNFASTITVTGTTGVTLPTTGTLATLAGTEAFTNKTYNGNTWTAGTGILTLAAAKTLTVSNTVTLTATDGSTLAIGAGGTLGSNAYTSTAYAPLASPTFTGVPAAPTATISTNTTQLATTAFVMAQFAAPGAIGGTTAAAMNATTIGATGNITITKATPQLRLAGTEGSALTAAIYESAGSLLFENAGINTWMTLNLSTGALALPGLASSSAAQTGTMCWTTGTGNITIDTTTTCLLSDEDAKHDVDTIAPEVALAIVMKFEPVSFFYNDPSIPGEQVGFTAQRMAKADERLVTRCSDGHACRVRYSQSAAFLAGAIQKLKAMNDNLAAEVRELKRKGL